MIEAGAESLTFSLIPPALDQVFVGNMDLSRMYGLNDCVPRLLMLLRFNDSAVILSTLPFLIQLQRHIRLF